MLKGKKGRIIGACYTQFLNDGKIYNRRGEEVSSVVKELQRDSLDRKVPITELLRKAFFIAKKLHIEDFEKWASQELNGYTDLDDIPTYRHVSGNVKGWNPYHGWIPVIIEDHEVMEKISNTVIAQSIAEVETLSGQSDANHGLLQIPFSPQNMVTLGKWVQFQTQFTLMIPSTTTVKILDAVRNIILNWSIKLEEDNILGEDLSFTPREKKTAEMTAYTVNNFYGAVQHQQIQQHTSGSLQVMKIENADLSCVKLFLESIKKQLHEIELPAQDRQELESDISTALAQVESPKPKHRIIRESLNSIRRILEGTGGQIAGKLLMDHGPSISQYLSQIQPF